MGLFQLITFLLIGVSLNRAFPTNDEHRSTEEIDSDEHGQFAGPKSTNCSCGWTNKEKGRIVGGRETYVNEFPHMAGVVKILDDGGTDLFCGSSIVTPYHAVTAAHCTYGEELPLAIITGEHDTQDGDESQYTKMYEVKDAIEHPDYVPDTFENDISLLVIGNRIDFSTAVGPICLPTTPINDFLVGKHVKVTGWGATSFGGFSSTKLLKVNLKVIPLTECAQKITDKPIGIKHPYQICTYRDDKDSCQGDSGGPVTWLDPETNRYTLVGLVSFGVGCAWDTPGVNTDVQAFLPWLHNIIEETSPSPVTTCAKRND